MSSSELWVLVFGTAAVAGVLISLIVMGKLLRRGLISESGRTGSGRAMEELIALQTRLLGEGSGMEGSNEKDGNHPGIVGGDSGWCEPGQPGSIGRRETGRGP